MRVELLVSDGVSVVRGQYSSVAEMICPHYAANR